MQTPALEELAAAWLSAKAAETAAVEARRAIDAQISALLATADEGTAKALAGSYKVTVTTKVTRTIDADALRADWASLSPKTAQCFRWKPEVDLKHMKAIRELLPDEYAIAARYITAKPATPAVAVERAE